jgi:hypothetical protein
LAAALPLACGGTTASAPSASRDARQGGAIAAVHAHRCGQCHAPPEPKTHTRGELEEAFRRHKGRVRLTADEWQAMVDYLAPRESGAAETKN